MNTESPEESSSDISDKENGHENLDDFITEGDEIIGENVCGVADEASGAANGNLSDFNTESSGTEDSILEENVTDAVINEGSGATNAAGLGCNGSQSPSDGDDIKEEIVNCILRGLILAEEMTYHD